MARLGYPRYGAQGGDWGAQVTTALGMRHPEHLAGIHLNMPIAFPDPATPASLTEREQAALAAIEPLQEWDSGYSKEQSTRPQTLGYGLVDSPAGLCAWIVEKFWAWTDCDGDPANVLHPGRAARQRHALLAARPPARLRPGCTGRASRDRDSRARSRCRPAARSSPRRSSARPAAGPSSSSATCATGTSSEKAATSPPSSSRRLSWTRCEPLPAVPLIAAALAARPPLLEDASRRAQAYLAGLAERRVAPAPAAVEALDALDFPLPGSGRSAAEVLALLDDVGSPATVASAGPRYFGFVTGAALPVAVATAWLTAAWDQNAGCGHVARRGPARRGRAALDDRAARPARRHRRGLRHRRHHGQRHLPGRRAGCGPGPARLGRGRPGADRGAAGHRRGRRRGAHHRPQGARPGGPGPRPGRCAAGGRPGPDRAPRPARSSAGPRSCACRRATSTAGPAIRSARSSIGPATGAWVHVDGAFGLWAAASPAHRRPGGGRRRGGLLGDRRPQVAEHDLRLRHRSRPRPGGPARGDEAAAAYLPGAAAREPMHFTPQSSQRARGAEVWAALATLGRDGVADLVERSCRLARRAATACGTRGSPSSTTSCSTRSWSTSATRTGPTRSSPRSSATEPAGAARPPGTTAARCASA